MEDGVALEMSFEVLGQPKAGGDEVHNKPPKEDTVFQREP